MSLVGTQLGPYQVLSKLGEGGMGEVYRARDSRLERDVAVKVLSQSFTSDEDRLRRFTIEAQATGALNHPNILAIYDVGRARVEGAAAGARAADVAYIVTELLDGATLRARLDEGRLPTSKALDVARQIASGLAAAHGKGITHRDIKPENIFVTTDGRAKILDFGLAKQREDLGGDATRLQSATAAGVVLGTVGYMSPEQVRGEAADTRSDIFSFGVVLFELLSGQRPFAGATAVQTMNAILTEDPPEIVTGGRPLPAALDRVVRHCLEKNPDERFQSARDLAFALDALGSSSSSVSTSAAIAAQTAAPRPRRALLPMLTAVLALACAGLAAMVWLRPAGGIDLAAYKYAPFATDGEDEELPIWSPDGRQIAYQKSVNGQSEIFIRAIGADAPQQLTQGDQGGRPLFWWPDSSRIGFISNGGKISAVSRLGGTPEVVQNDNFYFAATLSPDGKTLAAWRIDQPGGKTNATVVIASPPNGPFREYAPAPFRLSATLSPVRLAFAPDGKSLMLSMYENDGSPAMWQLPFPDGAPKKIVPANLSVSSPLAFSWMPDSRRAVVSAHGDLWMLDVASGATSAVSVGVATQTEPSVSPDGTRLAFMVGAANFDLGALPLDGSAMRDVFATAADESAGAWIAGGPRFLYVTTRSGHSVIRLRAPDGTDRPIVEAPAGSIVIGAVPSPDGQRVAYGQLHGAAGIWVVPLAGGEPTRISDGTLEFAPTWSPDGQRIAHVWFDNGVARLRVRRIGSSETPVAIPLIGDTGGMPEWSPDGQWIAMSSEKGIQLLSPDGKSHKEIAAHRGAALQWSSDSRTIYSVFNTQPDQMALASIDVQSGKEKVVCTLPRGVGISSPLSPSLRLTLSADGKSLLTTIVRSNTDIWTLDHFWR